MRSTKETESHVAAVDDPFERLPEHILHHILALLRSNKEAARTAVVSRSWHNAWSSYPIFDFRFWDFRPKGPASLDHLQTINDWFLDFVGKAMSRLREHKVAIPRLTLKATDIKINHYSRDLLHKWIGMALDSGAQELCLDFDGLHSVGSYPVPARAFSSGSIKTMSLVGRGLITPLDSISTVNLSSLQSLKLSSTPLDEPMLQKLLRGCPLLEELKLFYCEPLTQVIISGPNNLRMISLIGPVDRVEIEGQSLEELKCSGKGLGTLLTWVILDCCPRLKHLTLKDFAITRRRFQKLLSKLPLLESLVIGYCVLLKKIIISNPLLKKIEIEECKGLVDIEIGSANLSCFLYQAMEMQLPFIRMQNPTGISIGKAYFECKSISSLGPNWFIQLRQFLTRSCRFQYLSLSFDAFDEEEGNVLDTGDLPSLPYDVDELHLSVPSSLPGHAAILNMVLSLLRPAVLRVTPYWYDCDVLKYLCEKLENRGLDDGVCSLCSGHRKCWLHELKGVEISCDNGPPLDWPTLHKLLPNIELFDDAYFTFYWK